MALRRCSLSSLCSLQCFQDCHCCNYLSTEEVARVKGQNFGTVSTEDCVPPAQVFASEETQTVLGPLFPPNAEAKVGLMVALLKIIFDDGGF